MDLQKGCWGVVLVLLSAAGTVCGIARADMSSSESAPLPFLKTRVKTCAAFKDGTVFIVREGTVDVDSRGVVLTEPIIEAAFGTVGAASSTDGVKIRMLTATTMPGADGATRSFRDAAGNASGRPVAVRRVQNGKEIRGTFLGLRAPSGISSAIGIGTVADNASDPLIVIREDSGIVSLVSLSDVLEWRFLDEEALDRDPHKTGQQLRIQLEGTRAGQSVTLCYFYLWRGVQWVPSYLAERRADGMVDITLRAEIINNLIDLEGTDLYLVVGVPSFCFIDNPSPLVVQKSMEQVTAALSRAQPAKYTNMLANSFTNIQVSNDLMRGGRRLEQSPPEPAIDRTTPEPATGRSIHAPATLPDMGGTDAGVLHLFRQTGIDLQRGERAIVTLSEMKLACRDVVEWVVADGRVDTAAHSVTPTDRAANPLSHYWAVTAAETPLTTGSILIMKDAIALSQDRMYYTPRGGTGRVSVGKAVGVQAWASEEVTSRQPGAKEVKDRQDSYQGRPFWLMKEIRWIDEQRTLRVTVRNGLSFETDVVVRRTLRGNIDAEGREDMTIQRLGGRTDTEDAVTCVTWDMTLKPGESRTVEVEYEARIFTRR